MNSYVSPPWHDGSESEGSTDMGCELVCLKNSREMICKVIFHLPTTTRAKEQ